MNSIKQLEYYQCRTCYDSTNNLQQLTNSSEYNPSQPAGMTYVQLLYEVCNINIQDDKPLGQWPQFICFNCSQKLKLAHDFIQHTHKVNQLLKSIASLLEKENEMDFIKIPELDIPLEIKTEKEEFVEVPNERVFQYSPIETETLKTELKNANFTNNKMVEHENIKEIIVPSEIEFLNNNPTVINDLDYFHSEYLNYMDSKKSNHKVNLAHDESNTLLESASNLKHRKCFKHASDERQTAHKLKNSKPNTQVKTRAGVNNFNCNECKKIFTTQNKMLRHKRFVHIPEEEKIKCHICGHKFARSEHFKRHMKFVHGTEDSLCQEALVKIKGTRFFCNKCDRSFTRRDRLLKHKKDMHKNF